MTEQTDELATEYQDTMIMVRDFHNGTYSVAVVEDGVTILHPFVIGTLTYNSAPIGFWVDKARKEGV